MIAVRVCAAPGLSPGDGVQFVLVSRQDGLFDSFTHPIVDRVTDVLMCAVGALPEPLALQPMTVPSIFTASR